MKERPILFRGPMVRAILDGKKTQTRRVFKPRRLRLQMCDLSTPPHLRYHEFNYGDGGQSESGSGPFDPSRKSDQDFAAMFCPHGIPGDRLWVRETWRLGGPFCDDKLSDWGDPEDVLFEHVHYAADEDDTDDYAGTYRPSIHMPRWASRITLEVTGVRVERVQDIGKDDAIAEGMQTNMPLSEFKFLWGQINGKRPGCDWESNPWVWVIEFKVT